MAKDPAVLFYTSDFIADTLFLTNEQTGAFIILLCLQHTSGHLTKEKIDSVCKGHDEVIYQLMEEDENGLYYNERMEEAILNRQKYCDSRRKNYYGRIGGTKVRKLTENEAPIVTAKEPAVAEVAPVVAEVAPAIKEVTPVIKEVAPAIKEVAPVITEVVPAIKEVAPVITEVAPAMAEVTPVITEAVPVIKEVTPVITEVAPAIKEVAPVIKEVTPVIKEVAPVIKEVAPYEEAIPMSWEKKAKERKTAYGANKNVLLTQEEYEELKKRFPFDYESRIDDLSYYIVSKGDKYKSHYFTILSWSRNAEKASQSSSYGNGGKVVRANGGKVVHQEITSTFDEDEFFMEALERTNRELKSKYGKKE
ncbi:MAG: hypothetical protein J6B29_00370 [Clostridia bacterium]|nr:hypothetical protein [Clostridia bacterium]